MFLTGTNEGLSGTAAALAIDEAARGAFQLQQAVVIQLGFVALRTGRTFSKGRGWRWDFRDFETEE